MLLLLLVVTLNTALAQMINEFINLTGAFRISRVERTRRRHLGLAVRAAALPRVRRVNQVAVHLLITERSAALWQHVHALRLRVVNDTAER